jgi:hypothetical protein
MAIATASHFSWFRADDRNRRHGAPQKEKTTGSGARPVVEAPQ